MKSKIGIWSFIVGLLIAAIIAILSIRAPTIAIFIMAVLGIVVGLLNVADKETELFLVASIAFLLSFQALSAVFRVLALGWEGAAAFFGLLSVFIAPATAIVALKALYKVAKN